MTSALSFLNDLAQWLGRWIPRLTLVEATHRGVLFGPRGSARQVGPGLVVYWPITHALLLVPITTQSVQMCSQMLPARVVTELLPHVTLSAAAVQFRIVDVVANATKVLNTHALVDNRTQAAIARHVAQQEDLVAWSTAAVRELAEDLRPFGVVIERLDFTQHGIGVALKNISDWANSDFASGTRPKE